MTAHKHLTIAAASLLTLWMAATAIHWALFVPHALTPSAHAALLHVLGSTVETPPSQKHMLWSTATLVIGFLARVHVFSVIALFAVKPYIDRRVRDAYAYARIATIEESTPGAVRGRGLMN
jgi:hypothetical protein